MANYDVFGKFYDAIMGDRGKATKRLREFIHKVNPKAQNVLELGCGTGSVLKHLVKDYEVWGADLSKKMLSLAEKKVPQARLSRQDMVRFRLPKRFDVICCVFDSINHILSFADWKKLFANVGRHCTSFVRSVYHRVFDQKRLSTELQVHKPPTRTSRQCLHH